MKAMKQTQHIAKMVLILVFALLANGCAVGFDNNQLPGKATIAKTKKAAIGSEFLFETRQGNAAMDALRNGDDNDAIPRQEAGGNGGAPADGDSPASPTDENSCQSDKAEKMKEACRASSWTCGQYVDYTYTDTDCKQKEGRLRCKPVEHDREACRENGGFVLGN